MRYQNDIIKQEREQSEEKVQNQGKPPLYPGTRNSHLLVPPNVALAAIIEGLEDAASGAENWCYQKEKFPTYRKVSRAGHSTMLEYGKTENEIVTSNDIAQLFSELQQCSDLTIDVLLYSISACCLHPNERTVWIWGKDFLSQRGRAPITKATERRKRSHGHRSEDLAEIGRSLHQLENIWLTIHTTPPTRGRKPRRMVLRGRLLIVHRSWSQVALDGSFCRNIAWEIELDALREYLAAFPKLAYFPLQILQYDPYREQWEKRLARYLFFHLHFNQAPILRRTVGELLDACILPIDQRNPERTKQRLEKALSHLVKDHFLCEWSYIDHNELPARGWLDIWLDQRIELIAPPPGQTQGQIEEEDAQHSRGRHLPPPGQRRQRRQN